MTLLAMLFVSSSQGAFEECAEEQVSQEIELVMGRRDQRKTKQTDSDADFNYPVSQAARKAKSVKNRFFVIAKERVNMNGSGTHLLI